MAVPASRRLKVGDEITVYNVSGTHTGSFVVKVDDGGAGYEFDSSTLLTDGKLRVTAVADGVSQLIADDALVDIYTTGGLILCKNKPYAEARASLRPGTYIVTHGNSSSKIRIY